MKTDDIIGSLIFTVLGMAVLFTVIYSFII